MSSCLICGLSLDRHFDPIWCPTDPRAHQGATLPLVSDGYTPEQAEIARRTVEQIYPEAPRLTQVGPGER